MKSKQCFKCKQVQPISNYYRHPMMGDGHLNKCKECTKADSVSNYTKNRSSKNWLQKERARCRIKSHIYRILGKAKPTSAAVKEKWAKLNPQKVKSQAKLRLAVKRGVIIKPEKCSECGSGRRLEGHHEDYTKPLAVIWLCPDCHGRTKWKS